MMKAKVGFSKLKKSFIVLTAWVFLAKVVGLDVETCYLFQTTKQEIQTSFHQIVSERTLVNHISMNFSGSGGHTIFCCHSSHNCKYLSNFEMEIVQKSEFGIWDVLLKRLLKEPFLDVPIKPPIS